MRAVPKSIAVALTILCATAHADADPETGLEIAPGWELVRLNCTACHSSKLITQQRGTADQWLSIIRWMQKTQNLWPLDPDTEAEIIEYLSTNYPPPDRPRRKPIPAELMPPPPDHAPE